MELRNNQFVPTNDVERGLVGDRTFPVDDALGLVDIINSRLDQVLAIDPTEYPLGARRKEAEHKKRILLATISNMREVIIPHVKFDF